MAMKLWILRAREDLPKDDNPWVPWYDKMFSIIIRASDESEARQIATENGYDESRHDAWLNSKYSTCDELTTEGESGAILADIHNA